MAVHHVVDISCQRNNGYRPCRVNIMGQGLSTPDPSLSSTHLRRGRTTTTHYKHHQVSVTVSHSTTLVPSLGLCIGPACKDRLSAGMRRECVSTERERKKDRKKKGRDNTSKMAKKYFVTIEKSQTQPYNMHCLIFWQIAHIVRLYVCRSVGLALYTVTAYSVWRLVIGYPVSTKTRLLNAIN